MVRKRLSAWSQQVQTKLREMLTERRERHGIALSILDSTRGIETDQLWRNLDAALDLIVAHRPIWIGRMRRMENRIHVQRTPGTRAKLVDERWTILDSYFVANYLPAQIAASIIHEATHARMRACGIPFAADNPAREERACRRSELRFGRVLLAEGVEGAQAVLERAGVAFASDEEVGVVVDWNELRVIDLVARIDELPFPRWLKRIVARRRGVLDTPHGRATFGNRGPAPPA